jgi:arylsulfatase A-like enzyme
MNIILVVFDSLRQDCLGVEGCPPWGEVHTPRLDAFAQEALTFTRAFPESLPTLPARRALYTGQRVFPFFDADFHLKGDFTAAPGWGPIPEAQDTLAELLKHQGGYRTGLVSDVYHMFKPSKNFWRGFDQWLFLRGQEADPYRSGPEITQTAIDHWLSPRLQQEWGKSEKAVDFVRQCLKNMWGRDTEEDYFAPRVMIEAARWLEQNQDADQFFLVVECFDPHEPWFVPDHYRCQYGDTAGPEQVLSPYFEASRLPPDLLRKAQTNYSALVTMCDRWFGHLYDTARVLGVLDETVMLVVSDHGHSLGDGDYMGKRGYPSRPEVFDLVLMVRHPQGAGAGRRSDLFLQHTDVAAQILEFAGVEPAQPLDGRAFWQAALDGGPPLRDHVTVGWGGAMTVLDDRWWMNSKIDGTGILLHDLTAPEPFAHNVADRNPEVVRRMQAQGVADAGGAFPEYLIELAGSEADAPGCSALAARD